MYIVHKYSTYMIIIIHTRTSGTINTKSYKIYNKIDNAIDKLTHQLFINVATHLVIGTNEIESCKTFAGDM